MGGSDKVEYFTECTPVCMLVWIMCGFYGMEKVKGDSDAKIDDIVICFCGAEFHRFVKQINTFSFELFRLIGNTVFLFLFDF